MLPRALYAAALLSVGAAAVAALLASPALRRALSAALRELWEGDVSLQHGAETLAVVSSNLLTMRAALADAATRPPPARRAAAAGIIADAQRNVDDLDACLRASDDKATAAWQAARKRKREMLEECHGVEEDARELLR